MKELTTSEFVTNAFVTNDFEKAAKFVYLMDAEELAERLNAEAPEGYKFDAWRHYWDAAKDTVHVVSVYRYGPWQVGSWKLEWDGIGWVPEASEAVQAYRAGGTRSIRGIEALEALGTRAKGGV